MKPKSDQKQLKKRLTSLLKQSCNKICADCPEKRPTWGTLIKPHGDAPLGSQTIVAFVCFQCASIHRRLGTHICFVRSVTLDDWTEADVDAADVSGNDAVNKIYEANLQKMKSDNPSVGAADASTIKPLQGAHVATRERYIRSKYVDLDYYSKHAHYEHLAAIREKADSPPKSPLKKLGVFLSKEKDSLGKMLSGSRLTGGSKSVCSATVESSPSSDDNKSCFSAPLPPSNNNSSKEDGTAAKQLRRGKRGGGNQTNQPADESEFFESNNRSLDLSSLNSQEFADFNSHDSKGDFGQDGHERSQDFKSTKSQDFMVTSNHSFLLRKPEVHCDPRRSAFQNSRGGFDVSPEDLKDDEETSQHNKVKPVLVSTTVKATSSNSRMNMYSQRSSRGRSSSRSRIKEPGLDSHQRTRSTSRARDHGEKTRGRRGRSRSVNKDNDITAGATRRTKDRSSSRVRSASQTRNNANEIRQRGQSRSRRARSGDPTSGRLNESRGQIRGPGNVRNDGVGGECKVTMIPPERSKSEDLTKMIENGDMSGMTLVFEDSCTTFDTKTDDPHRSGRRRGSSRRPRSQSRERRRDENPTRRNRSQSRGRPPSASRISSQNASKSPEKRSHAKNGNCSDFSENASTSPTQSRRNFSKPNPTGELGSSPKERDRSSGRGRKDRSSSRGRGSSRNLESPKVSDAQTSHSPKQNDGSRKKGHGTSRDLESSKAFSVRDTHSSSEVVNDSPEPPPSMKSSKSLRSRQRNIDKVPSKAGKPLNSAVAEKNMPESNHESKTESMEDSGEGDFHVIASSSFVLGGGKGSNHSDGSFSKPFKLSSHKSTSKATGGSEGLILEKRRASRNALANRAAQRQTRKSDIFASLDKEEDTFVSLKDGPLMRKTPMRTKSTDLPGGVKSKLMIRPSAPPRSKSCDGIIKPTPKLNLSVALGSGQNNKALMKEWETMKNDTSTKLTSRVEKSRYMGV